MSLLPALLPTRLPLIQAPMAGCQDERLAIAVSGVGALGSMPTAMLDLEALDASLARLQAAGLPYNVNFFAHRQEHPNDATLKQWVAKLAPFYRARGLGEPPYPKAGRRAFDAATAEVLSRYRPAVVSFHFGLPGTALLEKVRRTGALIVSTATTLPEALHLQSKGADAVIAQGIEAGGHRGHFLDSDLSVQRRLDALLPVLVERLSIPVIAAGGLGTAALVDRALNQGAAAVQVGTAFLLADEATTHPLHRERLKNVDEPTLLTNLFSGGLARGLPNGLTRELGGYCTSAPPFPWASSSLAPLRQWAEARGLDDFTPLWSGTHRTSIKEAPAAEIVRDLMASFSEVLPAAEGKR